MQSISKQSQQKAFVPFFIASLYLSPKNHGKALKMVESQNWSGLKSEGLTEVSSLGESSKVKRISIIKWGLSFYCRKPQKFGGCYQTTACSMLPLQEPFLSTGITYSHDPACYRVSVSFLLYLPRSWILYNTSSGYWLMYFLNCFSHGINE